MAPADGAADGASLVVGRHLAVFQAQVERAEAHRRAGRLEAAAVYAQIAAKYAASRHPGLFVSPRLEQVLLDIGDTLAPTGARPSGRPPEGAPPRRVLHVLTQVAGIGGHTRMVWRWIQQDASRTHSVVLTRQGSVGVPPPLQAAVTRVGGQITRLDARRGSLLTWARDLRELAAGADVAVLHVNPDDVIPTIAFGGRRARPPVVYLDHADQLFWTGAAVVDVLASQRASGAALARERRGIAPERVALLPIVLDPALAPRTLTRAEAKARLGLAPDAVLLLSVARAHKYAPFDGQSLPETLLPLLEGDERLVLLALGPSEAEGDAWARARRRTRGRVHALGTHPDTALFYQAADVYLDSFPLPSITSLLEAGSYGTPLVSCCPCPPAPPGSVLGADTPALDRCLIRAAGPAELRDAVGRLAESAGLRQDVGEETRETIAAVHTGTGWQGALEGVYERALAVPPASGPPAGLPSALELMGPARPFVEALDRMLPQLFNGEPDLDQITQSSTRLLPPALRLREWIGLVRRGGAVRPGLLLPEWLATRLERRLYPNGSDAPALSPAPLPRVGHRHAPTESGARAHGWPR
jgi:hypothetical protein